MNFILLVKYKFDVVIYFQKKYVLSLTACSCYSSQKNVCNTNDYDQFWTEQITVKSEYFQFLQNIPGTCWDVAHIAV